jgi:hypothetical protein
VPEPPVGALSVDCRTLSKGRHMSAHCDYVNGWPKYQLAIKCAPFGTIAYSPIVPVGTSTEATCQSNETSIASHAFYGRS